SGIAAQHPRGVGEVPRQCLQKWDAAAVAVVLFGWFNSTELDDRRSPGLGRRKARPNAVVDVQLQVGFQFLGELAVAPVPGEQALEADEPGPHLSHETSLAGARKRSMMVVACFHWCASLASCFLPARVTL